MDLPVLWGEFLMGGIFTVNIISVNMPHPPHFSKINTVNMPPLTKTAVSVGGGAYLRYKC